MRFKNRGQAGKELAEKLKSYANQPDVIVLALARGGVPVAFEIAEALNAPLDVLNVRKLGVPGHEEMAMGAIATGGVRVMNRSLVRSLNISEEAVERTINDEQQELMRRERLYRQNRPAPDIQGKTVVLVDDGLATGATMAAAVNVVRQQHPSGIVVAVPIASYEACTEFEHLVDETVCLHVPDHFIAVGVWYEDFPQTTDEEVRQILQQSHDRIAAER